MDTLWKSMILLGLILWLISFALNLIPKNPDNDKKETDEDRHNHQDNSGEDE